MDSNQIIPNVLMLQYVMEMKPVKLEHVLQEHHVTVMIIMSVLQTPVKL